MGRALAGSWVVLSLGAGCAGFADLGGQPGADSAPAGQASAPAPDGGAAGGPSSVEAGSALDAAPVPEPIDAGPTLPSGILDPTFGGKGYVFRVATSGTPASDSQDRANAVAIDSLGRVVVGGSTQWQDTHAVVWRLTSDGAFDPAFGAAGAWWSTASEVGAAGLIDAVYGVFLDAQDRPVLGGQAQTPTASSRTTAWRLTGAGALDTSFGGTGEVFAGSLGAGGGPNDWTYAIAKDALGNLVLGGSAQVMPTGNAATALWRMTSAGALDTSFGASTGHAIEWPVIDAGLGRDDVALSVAMDHDGKIVIAGEATDDQGSYQAALWRFTSDGALDPTFNGTGRVDFALIAPTATGTAVGTPPVDIATGVAIDAQNGIVFCGQSDVATNLPQAYGVRAFVGRLLPSGALDTSFGTGGFAVLLPPAGGYYTSAQALAIDSKGRLVLAGEMDDSTSISVAAWRLSAAGRIDTSYGAAGMFSMTSTAGPGKSDHAFAVAIDPQDRVVLAGYSDGDPEIPSAGRSMAVWRLTP